MFPKLDKVASKAEALISKIDALLPSIPENDWSAIAYRWQRIDVGAFGGARGVLRPVVHPHVIRLDDVLLVKRLEPGPAGTLRVISDNPAYPRLERPLADVAVIGRVVWKGGRV
jgi:hypothetical protein